VAGAYQYKFNENGANTGWRPDPLNPRRNVSDNVNSILYAKNPTIHSAAEFAVGDRRCAIAENHRVHFSIDQDFG